MRCVRVELWRRDERELGLIAAINRSIQGSDGAMGQWNSSRHALMLEADSGPPGLFFAPPHNSGDESGGDEEELSVLPRHTKVIVTGNNRTKSVLVGLHGVVKKAVGLGGWHWLVLTNGAEVKLQRNALSVIEAPTGQEEDDDIDNPFSNEIAPDDFPRTFKPRVRPHKPAVHEINRIADESRRSSERRCEFGLKPAAAAPPPHCMPVVDLGKLDTAALRRYRRHFKLFDVGPNSSKEQLLQAVSRHFVGQQLDELQVITGFVQAAKRPRM